ncbi:unnamed protein product [Rhizoctonia solani]|uniref:Uncharacterized protein n=1 Tax=Rhizoctonia solani TaxID=456999 RepID=A0A8H3HCG8_9AGAM|nr:unnamed protein product [Rhizoctonia solani]
MDHWKDNMLLKIANIVGCLGFLGSNIYIYISSGGVYRPGKETYFTPAPYVFLVWPFLNLLQLGYIVYQFTDNGKKRIIDGVGWFFPLLMVLDTAYVLSWMKSYYAVRHFLALFLVLLLLPNTPAVPGLQNQDMSAHDQLWIRFPMVVHFVWASFLLILSDFEALGVDALNHPAGAYTKVFVFFGLWILEFLPSLHALHASSNETALFLSIPVTYVLFAIFEPLVFTISAFGALLKNLYRVVSSWRNNISALPDAERAPLLSGN